MTEGAPKNETNEATIAAIRNIIVSIPNAYSEDRVRPIVERIGARAIQILEADLRSAPKGSLKKAVEAWYQKFGQ